MPNSYDRFVASLTASERIELATQRTQKIADRLYNVIGLNEANRIIGYSDKLRTQIPRSHAAHAYNQFVHAMFRMEVIDLCTIWDRGDEDNNCIESIVKLIDDNAVIDKLADDVFEYYLNLESHNLTPNSDPLIEQHVQQIVANRKLELANRQKHRVRAQTGAVLRAAKKVQRSKQLEAIKNLRDKQFAHNLDKTRREAKTNIIPMRYGQETKLLKLTIGIVEKLMLNINGVHYDISEEIREIARDRALDLWHNCNFSIQE